MVNTQTPLFCWADCSRRKGRQFFVRSDRRVFEAKLRARARRRDGGRRLPCGSAHQLSDAVRGCVVRGISDLLDGKAEADKAGSQERAAAVASAVAYEMLATLQIDSWERSLPDEVHAPSIERPTESVRRESPFPEAKAVDGPARFRAPGDVIGTLWNLTPAGHVSGPGVTLAKGSATWLRLMPTHDPKNIWAAQAAIQIATVEVLSW